MSNKGLISDGSEYEHMLSSKDGRLSGRNRTYTTYGILIIIVLLLCGISFLMGSTYQKSKQSSANDANNEQPTTINGIQNMGDRPGSFSGGPGGGFGSGQRPNIGEVTAISADSISIQDSRSNTTQTFKVTSSTTVQNNGSTASVDDIKKGDSVLVTTDSSDTSVATQIMLNPSVRSAPPASNGAAQNTTPI